MGKGGKRKSWPRSWRQIAEVGGEMTLKGRGVEGEWIVLPLRVEVENPDQLAEAFDEAIAAEAMKQRLS